MNNSLKQLALFLGDFAVMNLSLYAALWLRYGENPLAGNWQRNWESFLVIFVFWVIALYISNLYNLRLSANSALFFERIGQSFAIASVLSVVFFYLAPLAELTPKTNLIAFIAVFAVLFFLWRRFFNLALEKYLPKNNIAIIGFNRLVLEIIKEMRQRPHLGYNISFIAADGYAGEREISNVPVFSNLKELPELLSKKKVSNVILAETPDSNELRGLLFECLSLKISFINLAEFYENLTGKIPLEVINKMWFLENLNEGNRGYFDSAKRFFDLFLSLAIFALSIIFWPLIALIIKIESRGPVFYISRRCGQGGEEFKMIKFRTMRTENNNQGMTEVNDRRITGFGNFLRKTRLDEIPQLINIIKGEMSFVGPRPERPEFAVLLERQIPFYRERTLVKPGITGCDQISGEYHSPSPEDTIKKLQYDLYYIKNRSVYLDLSIILKTISTVLSRAGR
jgi:exopolysaccharide biosynthesis polyprenyl glycosylphosphotransferase